MIANQNWNWGPGKEGAWVAFGALVIGVAGLWLAIKCLRQEAAKSARRWREGQEQVLSTPKYVLFVLLTALLVIWVCAAIGWVIFGH